MKIVRCHEFAPLDQLAIEEVQSPTVKGSMVLIDSEAIGVNYPDGLLVQGLYQMKPPTPFTPGLEVAGVVTAVGEKVTRFNVGDRVGVIMPIGGYAQQVAVHESMPFNLPDGVSAADATALMCGYGTSHHALKQRANLQTGETLLVLGAGGNTGLAAVEIGKAMGARVIAVASSQDKLNIAKQHGADDCILLTENLADDIKALVKNKGIDVVFDPIGGDAFDVCVRRMAWNGRYLVIGFASGRIPELAVNLALVKGFSLMGVFWGTFTQKQPQDYAANQVELFNWYQQGLIKPYIDKAYPFNEVRTALADVLNRKVKGKVILTP